MDPPRRVFSRVRRVPPFKCPSDVVARTRFLVIVPALFSSLVLPKSSEGFGRMYICMRARACALCERHRTLAIRGFPVYSRSTSAFVLLSTVGLSSRLMGRSAACFVRTLAFLVEWIVSRKLDSTLVPPSWHITIYLRSTSIMEYVI